GLTSCRNNANEPASQAGPSALGIDSDYFRASEKAFKARARTLTLAGFGLVMMNSPGLNGFGRRSPPFVACFLMAVNFTIPGRVMTPGPFLPSCFETTVSTAVKNFFTSPFDEPDSWATAS